MSKVIRTVCPVSEGKVSGTSTTEPATRPSAMGGRVRWSEPEAVDTVREVGTECSPSATTFRSMESKVTGLGRSYSSHAPAWWLAPNPGSQMVAVSPSSVLMAPLLTSPGSRPSE